MRGRRRDRFVEHDPAEQTAAEQSIGMDSYGDGQWI